MINTVVLMMIIKITMVMLMIMIILTKLEIILEIIKSKKMALTLASLKL